MKMTPKEASQKILDMYALKKQCRENIKNCELVIKDCDNIIEECKKYIKPEGERV